MSQFKVVLYHPTIPGNTGTIGRTCVALNLELILIRPYGFQINEKTLRRAGLDYWQHIKLKEYDNWEQFMLHEAPLPEKLFFFSKLADKSYFTAHFTQKSYLVFGSEVLGLPNKFYNDYPENFYYLPMYSENVRSLNLANAATAASYEALRQILHL